MREIKFRAWDGEQYVSPDYIDREGRGHWKEHSIPTSSADLEQYTGLKDKNGREIYEGDIRVGEWTCCAGCAHPEHYREAQTMTWLDEVAGFAWVGRYIPDWIDIEVAGNIHENPGLLP